jgi:hypothetical protein
MDKTLIQRLTECAEEIEECSQRISRIRAGEIHHQVRFSDGPWMDVTAATLAHYERLLDTLKYFAGELRRRINSGES